MNQDIRTKNIEVEFFGPFACITSPEGKVERMTQPVLNPSAARGMLNAVYSKPIEFYWQVEKIEILNPIKYLGFKRNEVKDVVDRKFTPIYADSAENSNKGRTQRMTVMLKDVRYRVAAHMVCHPCERGTPDGNYNQAVNRFKNGKCFYQPTFGLRECAAYFELSDGTRRPIDETRDLGLMIYDVFDLHDNTLRPETNPCVTLFHARLENGVLNVPDFDSAEVFKPGGRHVK